MWYAYFSELLANRLTDWKRVLQRNLREKKRKDFKKETFTKNIKYFSCNNLHNLNIKLNVLK